MFTGLIQAVGRIAACEMRGGDVRLRIAWKRDQSEVSLGPISRKDGGHDGEIHSDPFPTDPFPNVRIGESIAVSGVCLTVVECDARHFSADVSNETLACTTLASLVAGSAVNLERAMLPTDRLGGHFVAGHVDGVGEVLSIADDARSQRWRFAAPKPLLRYIAEKGSICVDGVSLTVNGVGAEGFDVNLVPHTITHTAFAQTRVGAAVNLEVDLVARYVERLLNTRD